MLIELSAGCERVQNLGFWRKERRLEESEREKSSGPETFLQGLRDWGRV